MSEIAIPPESQRRLLQLSRRTLEDFVRGAGRRSEEISDPYLRADRYGAFVSLHAIDELRGCIGSCTPDRRLYETVIEMTEAAARAPRCDRARQSDRVPALGQTRTGKQELWATGRAESGRLARGDSERPDLPRDP